MAQALDFLDDDDELLGQHDPAQIGVGNTGVIPPPAQKKPFDRGAYQQGWSGGSSADLQKYNDQWDGVTTQKDNSYLPTHEVLDMVFDEGGKNGYGWTDKGSWSGTPGAGATITPNAGSGGGGMSAGTAGSSGGSPFQDSLRSIILSQLGSLQQPSSINDPALKGQSDAYRVARERGAQQERSALAERAAFTGLNFGGQGSGAFDTGIQGIQEQAGQDEAGYDADLVGQDTQQKRQTLMTLLNMAVQSGDNESERELRMLLSQMDNDLRREGLGQQRYIYDDQTGRQISRDAEDDYRWRVLLGMGG